MSGIGLRLRVTLVFGTGSLVLSAFLAAAAYELTADNVLAARERSTARAGLADAVLVDRGLSAGEDVLPLLQALDTGRNRLPLVLLDGTWFSRTADDGLTEAVPEGLVDLVQSGRAATQRVEVAGRPVLVLGVPLRTGAVYVEVDDLTELDRTLAVLAGTLAVVALVTTLAGAATGAWAAARLLRPVRDIADTATAIAGGDHDRRLADSDDRDLAPLTRSFNRMVDELARRMSRDRRFAADVSHELRSPLQTLAAASAVLDNRAALLDDRSRAAAQLVSHETARFTALVEDLLELAKDEVPAVRSDTDVAQVVRDVVNSYRLPPEVVDTASAPATWPLDPRRLRGILANLVDNAARHAGGATAVRVRTEGELLVLTVEDAGPGIPDDEVDVVFARFGRGRSSHARRGAEGTGLGLALVAAHAAAHGGAVAVDRRDGGGARFVVRLPR